MFWNQQMQQHYEFNTTKQTNYRLHMYGRVYTNCSHRVKATE